MEGWIQWIVAAGVIYILSQSQQEEPGSDETIDVSFSSPVYPIIMRNDAAGSGYFGAPRGNNLHQGVDLIANPGQEVYSPITGRVVRWAYPYTDPSMKGILIEADDGTSVKMFYFDPTVAPNQQVTRGEMIGYMQSVSSYYNSSVMLDHIHLELRKNGQLLDPWPALNANV